MIYLVEISPSALNDAESAFLRLRRDSPDYADQWFNGLLEAIVSLEKFPNRCSPAPESQELGVDLRQLLYGKYRILFLVMLGN